MNLQAVANLNKMSLHVLVERVESGYFMASVPELADCVASAETRVAQRSLLGTGSTRGCT